ncbi:MAG: hypothetical protein ACTSO9_12925 [Candidatus Helarchaeota archaeon]
MGKKTIFKGRLNGTSTSYALGSSIVFKPDDRIEGMPEEFVVYARKLALDNYGGSGFGMKKSMATHIRPGDKLVVEGELIQEFEGKEKLEYVRMKAEHIYNVTLKCGF